MVEKWEVVPVDDPSREKPPGDQLFHEWAIVGPEKECPRIPLKHKETGDLICACVNAIRATAEPLGMDPAKFAKRLEGYPQIGVLLKCSTDLVPVDGTEDPERTEIPIKFPSGQVTVDDEDKIISIDEDKAADD